MRKFKHSDNFNSMISTPPGLTGNQWAEIWGIDLQSAYDRLESGDYYATGDGDDGDIHFITGVEHRGESCPPSGHYSVFDLFTKHGMNDGDDPRTDAVHDGLVNHLAERGWTAHRIGSSHNTRVHKIERPWSNGTLTIDPDLVFCFDDEDAPPDDLRQDVYDYLAAINVINAYVIGRHTPDFGDMSVNIVEQANVTWSATGYETIAVLEQHLTAALEAGCNTVLLQNAPGQLVYALMRVTIHSAIRIGIVVSKVSPELRAAPTRHKCVVSADAFSHPEVGNVEAAILAANQTAKITGRDQWSISFEVDAPMLFKFSHIEWLH